jgi:hypothetical protein
MRFKLLNGKQVQMVQYQITPDRATDNKKVHDMFRALSTFYTSPVDKLRGKVSGYFWWDVMIDRDSIRFYATFPEEWKREVVSLMAQTWEGASIQQLLSPAFPTIMPMTSDVCELKYRRSDMFAIKTDRRTEHEPLNSILSVVADLEDGDIARYSICAEPTSRLDWQDHAEKLHQEFRKGRTPKRKRISTKDVFIGVGELVTNLLQQALDTVYTVIGEPDNKTKATADDDKRMMMIDGGPSKGTVDKAKLPVFNSHIRIAAHSTDPTRQRIIMRTVANSFNDLTAENELERHDYHNKLKPHIMKELNTHRLSWLTRYNWDANKMSNDELGRLAELPSAYLQERYEQIDCMDERQIEVPAILTKGGIPTGSVEYKRIKKHLTFPTNDHDVLSLPTCVIGGMNAGKTFFASYRAAKFVEQGFSAILIDPKKSEVWNKYIPDMLPPEKRQRFLIGEVLLGLDFREVLHSHSARNRLAQIIMHFLADNTDQAGAQTARFLKAAVHGMRTGRIAEIMKIFEDKTYRTEIIKSMPEGMPKSTLQQFDKEKEDRQRQILSPIYNRLSIILDDSYLASCMDTTEGIDMLDIINKRGMCTVIDIPDRLNSREAKDIIINLLTFKLDIAMSLREENNMFPVAVFYDEPHRYLRSADIWKKLAVESRAYRIAFYWLFHSFDQLNSGDSKLLQIIKDAGPHYVLFNSSEETYNSLKKQISPFTVDEALKLKQRHAICIFRVGETRLNPLIVNMTV